MKTINKKQIQEYALDHCVAYADALAQNKFNNVGEIAFTKSTIKKAYKYFEKSWRNDGHYTTPSDLEYGDVILDIVSKAKTIEDLKSLYAKAHRQHFEDDLIRIQDFYDAMVCVIDYENNICKDIEYPVQEHTGTEDRGWWRVLSAIKGGLYFCAYDLGRDMGMAETFYKSGAITQAEYTSHIVKRTLNMMAHERFANDKGLPDYDALTTYLKPEYNEKYLDMKLINAVKPKYMRKINKSRESFRFKVDKTS